MLPAAAHLEMDAAKVARDTGANLILAPSARKSGDQVQLSYSLALATSPVQVDAGEVTGLESEWFRLENELFTKICGSLELAGGAARRPARRSHAVPPKATTSSPSAVSSGPRSGTQRARCGQGIVAPADCMTRRS
jgi:hypothetical protein